MDAFGEYASLFMKPSSFIANAKAKTALKYMRMGQNSLVASISRSWRCASGQHPKRLAGLMSLLCKTAAVRTIISSLLGRVRIKDPREFKPLMSTTKPPFFQKSYKRHLDNQSIK